MGSKSKKWIIGGVAAAMIGSAMVGTVAVAKHGHSPEQRIERITDRVSDRLDLDESQEAALAKVASSFVTMRSTTPDMVQTIAGNIKVLAGSEELSVADVNGLRYQIKAEFDRRADLIVPDFVAFYNTLDADQRETVLARIDKISERMEHRRNKQ